MSVFSNDLAPNLFKSYTDWFDNWVKETGHKPEKNVDDMACRYFDALDYDIEMVCKRCGHHLGYITSDDVSRMGPLSGFVAALENKESTFRIVCDHCRQVLADNAMFGGE